ncbi:60S ribosomal protein L18 [Thalictrum thalictroides]|uniref:60S ribosomal protein L18 n=1 Tax=Thalictrum thalictroides TaxID=46969 RepID=A0A7J6WJE3_THATH|nr:60S ribosomal protein L18 [Thalictrum thalictroides]
MNGKESKIDVLVGAVTDDTRVYEVPTLKIVALRAPLGQNTVLLRGPKNVVEAVKHIGKAPCVPPSHTKPYVRSREESLKRLEEKGKAGDLRSKCVVMKAICFEANLAIKKQSSNSSDCSTLITYMMI